MDTEKNHLTQRVRELMEAGQLEAVAELATQVHPADLADALKDLEPEQTASLLKMLEPKLASEIFMALPEGLRAALLEMLPAQQLARIVDELPSDEATDIVSDLAPAKAEDVLERIDAQDTAEVRALLKYKEDTAGGIMQLELVAARLGQSVAEVVETIRRHKEEVGDIYNVFVVDGSGRLKGVLPLAKLVLAEPDQRVEEIMEPCPLVVKADEDQEEVARKFQRYDVVSAAVVDDEGRLLGRITIDDVMEVMEEEVQEDFMRLAGSSSKELVVYEGKVLKVSMIRLPWLLTNLFGGLITGWLLWKFKVTLADALFLVTFIPVITAMGGNAGLQSSTTTVRGFALGIITFRNIWKRLAREVGVGLVMGCVCGTVVGIVAILWHRNPMLGVVVSLAMAGAITMATLMGTLAPAFFKRLGVDPAISSGPFVTTANDITGILIYFTIATVFYHQLVR